MKRRSLLARLGLAPVAYLLDRAAPSPVVAAPAPTPPPSVVYVVTEERPDAEDYEGVYTWGTHATRAGATRQLRQAIAIAIDYHDTMAGEARYEELRATFADKPPVGATEEELIAHTDDLTSLAEEVLSITFDIVDETLEPSP